MFVTTNVIKAKIKVIAIFPVTFAPPGRSPSKLLTKIKRTGLVDTVNILCSFFQCLASQCHLLQKQLTAQ